MWTYENCLGKADGGGEATELKLPGESLDYKLCTLHMWDKPQTKLQR